MCTFLLYRQIDVELIPNRIFQTIIAGRFGLTGLCQLHTKQFHPFTQNPLSAYPYFVLVYFLSWVP